MPRRFPIRLKLTIGALAPLVVAILVCWITGFYLINVRIVAQAQEKVRTDLNSAREVYQGELAHIRDVVKFTADAPYTADALVAGRRTTLARLLGPLRRGEQLDILTAVDRHGHVLFRTGASDTSGNNRECPPFVSRALSGTVVTGTQVLPRHELLAEGMSLADRAIVPVVATPRAKPSEMRVERSGMLLVAAAPVRDQQGEIVGALYGAVLLNNGTTLVDRIKRTVYEGVQFSGQDVGSATLFLGDLRIATNVQGSAGQRAVGTRMSEEVFNRVLIGGEKWVGRAFVVNDWYFTAYEPILDLEGRPVGSLYVGMLGKPYTAVKRNLNLIYGTVLFFGSLIGLAFSGYIGSRLSRPVRKLETLARRVAAGDRNVQITVRTRDEIGDLAGEFNAMTQALAAREAEVRELNRGLEEKVRERTAELEENNRLLVKTREELVRAEKLAAVGELAAGVAHEINNPLAIIRGNVELLQMSIPTGAPNREEIDTIAVQGGRVERIVANLLKFARRERKQLGATDLNRLLDEILGQIGHQVPLAGITVRKEFAPRLPTVEGDADQLRQVFTNLVLNAVQAMPGGGLLTVTTSGDPDSGESRVIVIDTGIGIPPENLPQIFNPFFTTKASGAGLGLSVSYGIAREHGGRIEVESRIGEGSTFRVILPQQQRHAETGPA